MPQFSGPSRSVFVLSLLACLLGGGAPPVQAQTPAASPSSDPAVQANRQFVEAMTAIQRAEQTYDLNEQAELLRRADRLLADIVTRLPESPLAVQLITNQFVGDFDYGDFKNRVHGLVCAEPYSTTCFLHRIEGLIQPVEYPITTPRWDLLSLAVVHHHIGSKERVKPIIAPFLSALRRNPPATETNQDLFLGRALALTGEVDLALELTRKIADCSTRVYNLTDITEALVWQGKPDRAVQVAEEAAEYARAQGCSWELGLVAQALLRVGLEGRARTLFLNTVEEQFSRFKDKRSNCCPPELAVAAGDLGEPNLALGLLRTVQQESPWTVPQVLGRLGARGEKTLALTYADELDDVGLKAETYVQLMAGALRAGDRVEAEALNRRLGQIRGAESDPLVLVQRARAERQLHGDQRWRSYFHAALGAAEQANPSSSEPRRDLAVPFLAALIEIETGKPMLD